MPKSDNIHCIVSKTHISETAESYTFTFSYRSLTLLEALFLFIYITEYTHSTFLHLFYTSMVVLMSTRQNFQLFHLWQADWALACIVRSTGPKKNIIKPNGLVRFDCVHCSMKIRKMYWTQAQSQQKSVKFFTIIQYHLQSHCECILVLTITNDLRRIWINIYNNVQ